MLKKLRIPIRYKVLAASLLVTTAAVSLITFTMANLFHTDKKAYIHDLTSTIVVNTARENKALLEGYQKHLQFFARLMSNTSFSSETKATLIDELFIDFPDLISVNVFDHEDRKMTLYDPDLLNKYDLKESDFSMFRVLRPLPLEKIRKDKIYIDNSTIIKELPSFTMAIQYDGKDNQPVIVSANIKLANLYNIIHRSSLFESFLIDENSVIFSHVNPDLVMNQKKLEVGGLDIARMGGSEGSTTEYSVDGIDYVAGFSKVGVAGLLTVVQIPKSAAFLSARSLLSNLIYVSFGLLAITTLISMFLARRFTKPIEILSEASGRLGKGNYDARVNVESSDEIGDLAVAFNAMATGLKVREKKLKQASLALVQSEKMSAFGSLAAGIAHEVKNPLTGMLGYAQLAVRKLDADHPIQKNLSIIEKETKRCKAIIDNLMKFARAEKSEQELFNVNKSLENASTIVNHQLGVNRVTLEQRLTPDLPYVLGTSNQIEQVVINLMINAQQAMEGKPGNIILTTGVNKNGEIEIRVKDDGPGMPDDVRSKIFEPFFTTKKAGEGTGLGLAVTYGLIQEHHGDIKVMSSIGHGTLFVITLPVAKMQGAEIEPSREVGNS